MDLVSKRYLIYSSSQALSPITSQGSSSIFHPHMHHSSTSFPIIAIAIIGILATAFLLVSYYIFVIKCCLNWHRIDILRRFSPSTRREDTSPIYSPGTEPRGLDEALLNRSTISSSPQHQNSNISVDQDFVVIELGNNDNDRSQNNALELPTTCPIISPSPRKLEQRKKSRKMHNKVTSMGDEWIDIRAKDEQFSVQPIRRSFSMDSSGDRHYYLAVQEALQHQNKQVNNEVNFTEGCSDSGRAKRSFFSFGYGSRSRSSVQPIHLDP
ncbi:unnamed protein product [Lupinus luteus]|uniref:RING-type E3 ubiquitin transferase n=1 Tax=Lupinus luteus TaxID=3873 RepID=A0AAV1X6A0_LUPLU